jgi:hypothetical protein
LNQCIDEVRRVFKFKRDRFRVPIICHLVKLIDINKVLDKGINNPNFMITKILYPLRTLLLED